MKGRASHLLYGLLAVAVGVWLVGQLGGEKRRIAGRLERLEELIEKDGAENDLVAANKARNVGLLFARDFQVDLKGRARGVVTERQRIAQVMLRYRSAPSRIELAFRDVEIDVGDGGLNAEMTAVAAASATTGGELRQRRFRLAFSWLKEDGEWVIRRAQLIEELEGPALF
jgi:SnoaL-like domain